MKYNGIGIMWLGHDGFAISSKSLVVVIDPFQADNAPGLKADIILVSHEHYDHCSPDDIRKFSTEGTKIYCSSGAAKKIGKTATALKEGQEINENGCTIRAVPAYNIGKQFHPKGLGIGFVLTIEGTTFYHAGDTDFIPEMHELSGKIDVAFLPVSGTYVMKPKEAAMAAETIRPKLAIPMHFGAIIASESEAREFASAYAGKTQILQHNKP